MAAALCRSNSHFRRRLYLALRFLTLRMPRVAPSDIAVRAVAGSMLTCAHRQARLSR